MISIKRYSSNGPHPRMLAVLLASDDPRTSWLFQGLAGWDGKLESTSTPLHQCSERNGRRNIIYFLRSQYTYHFEITQFFKLLILFKKSSSQSAGTGTAEIFA